MGESMKKIHVVLCPMDISMFRGPKPFELGGYAKSYNIPLPSTLSGAIRSILREAYPDRKDLYENEKDLRWRIKGPFPSLVEEDENGIRIEEFYPLPNDVFLESKGELVVLKPSKPYSYQVKGLELLSLPRLKDGEILKKPEEGLMDKKNFIAYLEGKTITRSGLKKNEDLFGRVERPGVTLDEKKVVRYGMFYRIEALEALWKLKDGRILRGGYMGMILSDENVVNKLKVTIERKRVIRFGGKSRPSSLSIIYKQQDMKWERCKRRIASRINKEKKFKVYLATPALFGDKDTSRWIPSWLNEKNLEGDFLNYGPRVKLVGMSMGRCKRISGWDYAKACVKPMYFGVPAGSVFYFSIEGDVTAEEIYKNVINRLETDNISDVMSSLGFGTAFIGVW